MMTKKIEIVKHTFNYTEVLVMLQEAMRSRGLDPLPKNAEIRARRGTASVKLETLEVKYREETPDHES